jgi:hypothetical protein
VTARQGIVGILVVCGSLLTWGITRLTPSVTHTRTFCAYNKVFVEFEEGSKTWGTLMLDSKGKPIPCSESSDEELIIQSTTVLI